MKKFYNTYDLATYRYIEFIIRRTKLLNVVMFNLYGKTIIKNIIKMIRLMTQYEFSPFYIKDIDDQTKVNWENISFEYKLEYYFFNQIPSKYEGFTAFLEVYPLINGIRCFDKFMVFEINFYSNVAIFNHSNNTIDNISYHGSIDKKRNVARKIRSLIYLNDIHRLISHKEEGLNNSFSFSIKININNSADNKRMHEIVTNMFLTLYSNHGITNFNLINTQFFVKNPNYFRSEFVNSMFESSYEIDYNDSSYKESYIFGNFFNVDIINPLCKAWALLTENPSKNCRFKCYYRFVDKNRVTKMIEKIKRIKLNMQKEK